MAVNPYQTVPQDVPRDNDIRVGMRCIWHCMERDLRPDEIPNYHVTVTGIRYPYAYVQYLTGNPEGIEDLAHFDELEELKKGTNGTD